MRALAAMIAVAFLAACEQPEPASKSTPLSDTAPAESLYFAGEYDSASALWRRELDSAGRTKDSLRQAHVLMWLGLAAWRQGNNAEARTLGEQSLELKKRIRGDTDISRSYNALGLLARDEGRLRDAADLFDQAIKSARTVADTAGVSRAAANIALIHLELGEFDKAREGFEAARDAGRALGDGRVEGNALNNLGMLTIRLGDPVGAVPMINAAIQRYKEIEYPTGEQNAFGQLATAYDLIGEPQRALAYLDSASRIARSSDMKTEEASNLRLMGQVYATMEDHRRALTFFARAQALSRELGLKLEEATTLRSSAASHLSLGNVDVARRNTLEALRIHRAEGAVWEEMGDLLMLAELATIASDSREASNRIADARGLARKLDVHSARAEVSLTEARIAARKSDWREVLRIVRASRSDLTSARADIAWEPLSLRARAFAELGDLDSALAAGREAIAGAERVRGRIASSGLRTGFTAARAGIYADLAIAYLRKGRPQDAFEVADAARGRALVEHLTQARAGIEAAPPATRDAVQGEMLLRQIDELVSLLEDVKRTPREERSFDERALNALSSRITRAEREYAAMLERNAAAEPAQATILGTRRVSAKEVQQALHADEVLLEYLVANDQLLVFAVSRSVVRHVSVPIGDSALSARVRFARELLSRRGNDSAAVTASLRGLHGILIDPVRSAGMLNGAKRLVVVPHSSLTYLPFAALRGTDGRYLTESHVMLTLPSAGALVAIRSEKPARQPFGNSVVVFAPLTRELPASKAEARSVAAIAGKTKSLIDADASELQFRDAAGGNRILHLATHSVLNVQNPLFSRIELARPGGSQPTTSTNDGRVSVHELITMRTQAPLVFLSGCETALGSAWSSDFMRGEDYATLSQALLYAGARSAIATLWRINDESAAVFAGHFYRSLKSLPPAEALARAQQNMLIDRRYRAPYHWAAYQVAGSGDRITLDEKRWWGLFAR
jgi:CHAT domain-containing protein/Tfp pilus assembly protein PilF